MTWPEVVGFVVTLLERFEEQEEQIPIVAAHTPKEASHELLKLEKHTSGRIDELIHRLSRGEKTATTSDEAYFLAQRLKYGLAIAQALATPSAGRDPFVPVPSKTDRESILTWLLIDVWHSTTRNIWFGMLEDT